MIKGIIFRLQGRNSFAPVTCTFSQLRPRCEYPNLISLKVCVFLLEAWTPFCTSLPVGSCQPATHAILAAAHTRRLSAEYKITTEGARATGLFLVQSGLARFYHLTKEGDLILLARLVPGDVIGLAAMLKSPPPYMATAEATSDCEVLAWEHSVIRKLVTLYPLLAENGLHIALDYQRAYMERHTGLVTKTAEARLAETCPQEPAPQLVPRPEHPHDARPPVSTALWRRE